MQDNENQLAILTDWAEQSGFETINSYSEPDSTWRAGHQKESSHLLDDARKRRFEVVLVWALDRLSHEGPLAILTLVHKLKTYGVKVISYQESWTEASDELGDLLYALAGWVARMES
jgi:putative DNA-invertase from lambdoid prophage Rac